MHTQAVLWITAIPVFVGGCFTLYGIIAPMMWEDGHPASRLTTPRTIAQFFFGGISLTCFLLGSLNFYLMSHSSKLELPGTVTAFSRVRVKNGYDSVFRLHADDGTDHVLRTWDIQGLANGDRVHVTLLAYNNHVLAITFLTGALRSQQVLMKDQSLFLLIIMTLFGCLFGLAGVGITTGFIGGKRRQALPG